MVKHVVYVLIKNNWHMLTHVDIMMQKYVMNVLNNCQFVQYVESNTNEYKKIFFDVKFFFEILYVMSFIKIKEYTLNRNMCYNKPYNKSYLLRYWFKLCGNVKIRLIESKRRI